MLATALAGADLVADEAPPRPAAAEPVRRTFLTADTHFGHANIIRYCQRPYASVEEMDEALVANWNATVGVHDLVYHLGDFSFHKKRWEVEELLLRLNGRKYLVLGNHDHGATTSAAGWAYVDNVMSLRGPDYQVVLFHYAMRTWDQAVRGSYMFYGHTHAQLGGHGRSLDVGVDAWGYRPVLLQDAMALARTQQAADHLLRRCNWPEAPEPV